MAELSKLCHQQVIWSFLRQSLGAPMHGVLPTYAPPAPRCSTTSRANYDPSHGHTLDFNAVVKDTKAIAGSVFIDADFR